MISLLGHTPSLFLERGFFLFLNHSPAYGFNFPYRILCILFYLSNLFYMINF